MPPFLIGVALLFWGWQTDFLIISAVMAAVLEGAEFVKIRWELSNEDFSRIWTFCALLFLASGAYAFTASNGPASVGGWFARSGSASVGAVSTKTTVLLFRWLPMPFFLFMAAQAFSDREGIPLETISLILRRRWRMARKSGRRPPDSRAVNVSCPYFIVCVFAASSHPVTRDNGYFWGLCGLLAWVLWSQRPRRFGGMIWAGTIGLAFLLAYGGQRGLARLKQAVDQYNPEWLVGFTRQGFDPLETRTEIGQIGRIKTSSQIVIRLETPKGGSAPAYLREAAYRVYKAAVWYAGGSADGFTEVFEDPVNSGNWPLIRGQTNSSVLSVACFLPGGKGLLPLPTDSGRLERLPAFGVYENGVGAVRAEGPGLVIFNALYGATRAMDHPPDANVDTTVPDREKPALDEIISELRLNGRDRGKTMETIGRFFATRFAYSLWHEEPKVKDTNATALASFLLKTHSGHCEYFATATVLLLRELGIPARYTVGYAVHEGSGNQYVVRQNDAHAWCRVWNDRTRDWEDFDTTPGTWLEAERQQRSTLQFLSDAWSRAVFEFSKFRWGQSHLRQYIWWALVPVLAMLLYQIIFRGGRRRARESSTPVLSDRFRPGIDSEYYQLETELAKRGLVRHLSEPPPVWLRGAATNPELSMLRERLDNILRLHNRYRFHPEGLCAEDRELLRSEVAICLTRLAAEARPRK
jgi:hypothetical protein